MKACCCCVCVWIHPVLFNVWHPNTKEKANNVLLLVGRSPITFSCLVDFHGNFFPICNMLLHRFKVNPAQNIPLSASASALPIKRKILFA